MTTRTVQALPLIRCLAAQAMTRGIDRQVDRFSAPAGMACFRRYGFGSLHEKDIERAGSVHSLDALEFDVAGRAWSRDEGQRS
jgi:hypothetical protein